MFGRERISATGLIRLFTAEKQKYETSLKTKGKTSKILYKITAQNDKNLRLNTERSKMYKKPERDKTKGRRKWIQHSFQHFCWLKCWVHLRTSLNFNFLRKLLDIMLHDIWSRLNFSSFFEIYVTFMLVLMLDAFAYNHVGKNMFDVFAQNDFSSNFSNFSMWLFV